MFTLGNRIATRTAFGETLVTLGATRRDIVVFEADIGKSTKTDAFGRRFPDRYFNVGVAEQNEMAMAAGAASCGKTAFVSTYAAFASMRACEQIRSFVAYPGVNVKMCVSHGGITPANDGVTHQATEDFGIMRSIPGMTVLMPADAVATRELVIAAAAWEGPVYLRLTRDAVPVIYEDGASFAIGQAVRLRQGEDVTVVAIGDMVCKAMESAKILSREGISVELIDMHTLKPLDGQAILDSVRKTQRVVTVEDHQVEGGLGSAVAEFLGEQCPVPMYRIGLRDTFAESGEYDLLLEKYKMSVSDIAEACRRLRER